MPTTILLMIDGVRPDALAAAGCTHLTEFQATSAYTMTARSLMPSVTLPCHMSIFHSVPPSRHGVTTNHFVPMARPLPGLVEVLAQAGKRAAFFHNWEPLRDLNRPGSLHHSRFTNDCGTNLDSDHATAETALRYFDEYQPDFVFVYFGTVDEAGHRYGWMTDGYLQQLAHVDEAAGRLFNGLAADTTILVQSDHGGHDRSHGTDMAEDMTIPWMISGPAIRRGYPIQSPVSLLDTAPTLAHVMGVQPHPQWEGQVVKEVFSTQ